MRAEPRPRGDRYNSGFGFMITSDGLSPIAPPWTSLTAYDLNAAPSSGRSRSATCRNWPRRASRNTGVALSESRPGGHRGRPDLHRHARPEVRALDVDTGKVLWKAEVDAALEGMPAVYEVGGSSSSSSAPPRGPPPTPMPSPGTLLDRADTWRLRRLRAAMKAFPDFSI